jgi:hypothetical protein
MTQNVVALCHIDAIGGYGNGLLNVIVSGGTPDGSLAFNNSNGPGVISVPVDPTTPDLKLAIYQGVQTILEASPFNVTFGANDVLRFID